MSTTVYTYNDKVLVNSANDKWLKKPDAPVSSDYKLVMTAPAYGFWLSGFNPNVTSGSWNDTDLTVAELTGINSSNSYYFCQGGLDKPLTLIISNVSADTLTLTFKYYWDYSGLNYTLYKTVGGTDTQIASGSLGTSHSSFRELTLNLT